MEIVVVVGVACAAGNAFDVELVVICALHGVRHVERRQADHAHREEQRARAPGAGGAGALRSPRGALRELCIKLPIQVIPDH